MSDTRQKSDYDLLVTALYPGPAALLMCYLTWLMCKLETFAQVAHYLQILVTCRYFSQ